MSHSRPSPMSRTKTTQIIAQLKLRGMTVCQSAGTGIRIAIEWQIQLGLTASMLAGGMTIKQSPPIKTPLPFSYPPSPPWNLTLKVITLWGRKNQCRNSTNYSDCCHQPKVRVSQRMHCKVQKFRNRCKESDISVTVHNPSQKAITPSKNE